ncbi:CPBP family glutamic-type intramembrane protease [Arsenicibacter rosenii]|uniref:CAAX prenyl protease 2/Lysostaphin resistance protein A-like domain-containing protein n=1 Tax=Arsenicibacter rosenii TaxID=1750698 RepID=A0A1S2VKH0_9BACT|nr:hypothetical protein BLX24_09585 [Arsenicibacter rosenii]
MRHQNILKQLYFTLYKLISNNFFLNKIYKYTLISICLHHIFSKFFFIFIPNKSVQSFHNFNSISEELYEVLIWAPVLESLLFQYLVIEFIYSKSKSISFSIIGSSLLFGLWHFYSINYILFSFSIGIFLSYTYLTFRSKFNILGANISVIFIHFTLNLKSLILNHFFN